jgi:hypothetical protein
MRATAWIIVALVLLSGCAHGSGDLEVSHGQLACELTPHPDPQRLVAREEVIDQMSRVGPYIRACASASEITGKIITVKYEISGHSGRLTDFTFLDETPSARADEFHACARKALAGVCFVPFAAERFFVQYPFKLAR